MDTSKSSSLTHIKTKLEELEDLMQEALRDKKLLLDGVHPKQKIAASNLLRYLVLRNQDIRALQDRLHIVGLSSMASSESHVYRQLQAILARLGKKYPVKEIDPCSYDFSKKEIQIKSEKLFGSQKNNIMVTFDASFTRQFDLIKNLLLAGMNIARINCAHDDEKTWSKMIRLLKKASKNTQHPCKIYMDIAGPKIRTQLLCKGSDKGMVKLKEGQLIWMSEDSKGFKSDDIVIGTTERGIISSVKKGEQVLFDDGLIRGVVERVSKNHIGLRILRIASAKCRLKAEKGINFPDTNLMIPSLTAFDQKCLPFICKHADMVGYSFVRTASDLDHLNKTLHSIKTNPPHVVLKIETTEAVNNLPSLLFQGMQEEVFGVMIARGDLAVEIGFERMGEIQEEILWICEAAHVPVIWATQVLENLNKSGIATRSEITDVAHAAMAECVMVNKGNHTIEVIKTLCNIFNRIGGHHIKKRFTFRPLKIASRFLNPNHSLEMNGLSFGSDA